MRVLFLLFLIIWCVQIFEGKVVNQPGNHGNRDHDNDHDRSRDHDHDHPYNHIDEDIVFRNIDYSVGIGKCPAGYWPDQNGKCREVYPG